MTYCKNGGINSTPCIVVRWTSAIQGSHGLLIHSIMVIFSYQAWVWMPVGSPCTTDFGSLNCPYTKYQADGTADGVRTHSMPRICMSHIECTLPQVSVAVCASASLMALILSTCAIIMIMMQPCTPCYDYLDFMCAPL